jgi:site-specific recombinase
LEGARAALRDCRQAVHDVLNQLDARGVSVDLVYRLDAIHAKLERLEVLLALLVPGFATQGAPAPSEFVAGLVRAQYARRGVGGLVQQSTSRLARKIIERAGHSGEHYITQTRAEWFGMLRSAAGGGVLTAGTAALKFTIAAAHLPLFFLGLFASINYAGSFLLMQRLGFTLATKQPSMTAAALAASLDRDDAPYGGPSTMVRRVDRLVDLVAAIARSQLAAAIGNVVVVVPTALMFDLLWRAGTRESYLDPAHAHHVVASLHVFTSGTIPFAALTGVLLWMASVAAGWLENWAVYRRDRKSVV